MTLTPYRTLIVTMGPTVYLPMAITNVQMKIMKHAGHDRIVAVR